MTEKVGRRRTEQGRRGEEREKKREREKGREDRASRRRGEGSEEVVQSPGATGVCWLVGCRSKVTPGQRC